MKNLSLGNIARSGTERQLLGFNNRCQNGESSQVREKIYVKFFANPAFPPCCVTENILTATGLSVQVKKAIRTTPSYPDPMPSAPWWRATLARPKMRTPSSNKRTNEKEILSENHRIEQCSYHRSSVHACRNEIGRHSCRIKKNQNRPDRRLS